MSAADKSGSGRRGKAVAFDIRVVIAALFGIFGVIIVLMGLFATSETDLQRADGTNLNLWTGAGLLVSAAAMMTWALLRPVVVADPDSDRDSEGDV